MKPKQTYRGVVLRDAAQASRTRAQQGAAVAAAAGAARVRVGREVAGRAGKGVTVVSGLTVDALELDELAARLKKLCGAGGTVKDGRIEIQGDHRDRLVAELCRLGFQAKRSGG
ncbi:MAG TPA: stress response translation initiation inhibitor YciH [Steroidobacteraceae bacterium]|nr:stress response translation initiation inhibitor YciH [Steroidobacteraceae bacterium]